MGCTNETCQTYTPNSGGVTVQTWHYPTQNTAVNWPGVERTRIMYGSFLQQGEAPTLASCGHQKRLEKTRLFGFSGGGSLNLPTYRVFDTVPSSLSFFPIDSDQWFAYLFDTSAFYVADSRCFKFLTYQNNTTGPSTSSTVGGVTTTTPGATTSTLTYSCTHCGGSVTPLVTGISYTTADGNITGIADRPFPTIYTASTNTNRIAFKYNSATTNLTNSVTGFSFTVGSTTTEAWSGSSAVSSSTSSVNNWQQDEYNVDVYQEYSSSTFGNKGLVVLIRFTPIVSNYSSGTYTFGGTTISAAALSSGGSNYSTSDSYPITYTYTHSNGSTSTFNFTLNVTAVGDVSVTSGDGASKITKGESVNGWTVSKIYHSDIENFPWHVIELSGSGSNFSKDANYTTSGGKSIQVPAGKGIPDRAMIVGLYEFRQKEIQYETIYLKQDVPHAFDDIVQPEVTLSVTNGVVTSANIVSGGQGFDKLPSKPVLSVSVPPIESGVTAELEGSFTNGVLTSVKIVNGGSGYSSQNPPKVKIANLYGLVTETSFEGLPQSTVDERKSRYKDLEEVVGSVFTPKETPKPAQDTDFSTLSAFSTASSEFENMPDHFLVKYFRPKTFVDVNTNTTIKTSTDSWGEKVFSDEPTAKEYAESLKTQGYDTEIILQEGKKFSEYIDQANLDYQGYTKETKAGQQPEYKSENVVTAEEFEEILASGSQKITQDKPSTIIGDLEWDPNTKVQYDVAQGKLPKEMIDLLPESNSVSSSEYTKNYLENGGNKELATIMGESVEKSTNVFEQFKSDATYDPEKDAKTDPYELPKVITVKASFSKLPCASRYKKYYIRQYVPDKRVQSSMNVTLTVSSSSASVCTDTCTACPTIGGFATGGTPTTNPVSGNTTSTTLKSCVIGTNDPSTFSASGKIDIYNNLTATSAVFVAAVEAWGNPFESECS